MQEAVIIDCLRTAVGKAPRGALRNSRPDDLAAPCIGAPALEKYPQVPKDEIEDVDPRLRHAGSRIGQQHGPHGGAARRAAGHVHRRDHQPLLQLRPAGHRHGRRPHPLRRRAHHHRRRQRIHEPDSARRQQARAQPLVRRSPARDLHEHGAHRRAGAAQVQHLARGARRLLATAAIRTRCAPRPRASSTKRSCPFEVETVTPNGAQAATSPRPSSTKDEGPRADTIARGARPS